MTHIKCASIGASLFILNLRVGTADVQSVGRMRDMFMKNDLAAHADLSQITSNPHVYALGPLEGLRGEILTLDGVTFVSRIENGRQVVEQSKKAKAIFLVHAAVPKWKSVALPSTVKTLAEIESVIAKQSGKSKRCAFLIEGVAKDAKYHIVDYKASDGPFSHEVHDKAKTMFTLKDRKVKILGFFTSDPEDGGRFVHPGERTHMHVITSDLKEMGHLESLTMASATLKISG